MTPDPHSLEPQRPGQFSTREPRVRGLTRAEALRRLTEYGPNESNPKPAKVVRPYGDLARLERLRLAAADAASQEEADSGLAAALELGEP